ncbi:MAG: hypothetical protein FWF85_10635 [Clostridiales bacterium]|jgi:2-methylisocitrate lyase-like PEP mutase family enzyme|nr:hypothetical protein [Clostridiales bacterium]MDR2712555.1 hypothetical protein [Clostridiales bacterium]
MNSAQVIGGESLGYETKVILIAVIDVLKTSKSLEEALERVKAMANAEALVTEITSKE